MLTYSPENDTLQQQAILQVLLLETLLRPLLPKHINSPLLTAYLINLLNGLMVLPQINHTDGTHHYNFLPNTLKLSHSLLPILLLYIFALIPKQLQLF